MGRALSSALVNVAELRDEEEKYAFVLTGVGGKPYELHGECLRLGLKGMVEYVHRGANKTGLGSREMPRFERDELS